MTIWTCDDDNALAPWAIDELEKTWNRYWAEPLRFRVFVCKGSKRQEADRLTKLLKANARWLNGSKSTPVDLLFEELLGQLLIAGSWLSRQDLGDVEGDLARPLRRTMGWHAFSRPDLQNLHVLCSRAMGVLPEADAERRRAKAAALKKWKYAWAEVEGKAVRQLREPERIEALLPKVKRQLAIIEGLIGETSDIW